MALLIKNKPGYSAHNRIIFRELKPLSDEWPQRKDEKPTITSKLLPSTTPEAVTTTTISFHKRLIN
jgi:hypothetical protein